jgi:predicted nucleic acid-binding protein
MAAFVLDASACMPWCCEDEATDASRDLLRRAGERETMHVPSIWPWELMNSVAMAVRRQRITSERAAEFLEELTAFDFWIAPAPSVPTFARLSALAARYQLTAYDTAYLDLARQLVLPLATLDGDLRTPPLQRVSAFYEPRSPPRLFPRTCSFRSDRSCNTAGGKCGLKADGGADRQIVGRGPKRRFSRVIGNSRPASNRCRVARRVAYIKATADSAKLRSTTTRAYPTSEAGWKPRS